MLGADVAELRELARLFQQKAEQLDGIERNLAWRIHSAPWHGPDVDRFKQSWDRSYRSILQNAARDLSRSATDLRAQADQQEEASAGGGGATGRGPSNGQSLDAAACRSVEAIADDMRGVLGQGDDAQRAWWNSLSDADKAALIAAYPALALQLAGLSDAERAQAEEAFDRDVAANTIVGSESDAFDIKASAGWVQIGVDGEAEIQQLGDGSYQVVLSGGADLGIGAKAEGSSASIGLSGDASATYTFASKAAADKFLNDLLTAAVPDNGGDVAAAIASPAVYVGAKYAGVFGKYQDHFVTSELEGKIKGQVSVKAGGDSVSVSGDAGVKYDTASKDVTYSLDYGAKGKSLQGAAVAADLSGSYALTVDSSGAMKDLVITTSKTAQAGVGSDVSVGSMSTMAGVGATVTTMVDLTNPANQRMAMDYLKAVGSGNFADAASVSEQLQQNSTVTIQNNVVATDHVGFDAWAVKGNFDHQLTQVDSLYVKAPGGDYHQVDVSAGSLPAGGSSGGR